MDVQRIYVNQLEKSIMRIKIIIAGVAIVMAVAIGTASAADKFATLDGVKAVPMSSGELDAVKGMHIHFKVTTTGAGVINPTTPDAADPLRGSNFHVNNNEVNLDGPDPTADGIGPGYNGLVTACGGVISIPGTC